MAEYIGKFALTKDNMEFLASFLDAFVQYYRDGEVEPFRQFHCNEMVANCDILHTKIKQILKEQK